MQTDSHILDDVARVATGAMGAASGLKGELDATGQAPARRDPGEDGPGPAGRVRRGQGDGSEAHRSESEALAERVAKLEARLAAEGASPEASAGAGEASDGR